MRQLQTTAIPRSVAMLGAAALVLVLAAACDSRVDVRGPRINLPTVPTGPTTTTGATVTESRPISGVEGVSLAAVGLVDIRLGGAESLTITAPESVMHLLTSRVESGRLVLDRDSASYQGQVSDIRYDLTLRRLDELIHEGVGEISAAGLDTGVLEVRMTGVGNVVARGRAEAQELHMSGLGDYNAASLESRVARVDIQSGDAVIWATERIEGRVAFGCTLEYLGNPVVEVEGGGAVRKIGLGP